MYFLNQLSLRHILICIFLFSNANLLLFGQVSQQWVRKYGYSGADIGKAIVLDNFGNAYVTGSSWEGSISQEDYATIKYNSAGVQQWIRKYSSASGPDVARAIALDDSGNVYITGSSWGGSISQEDYATVKYNSAGVQQWVRRYSYGSGPDIAYDITLDDSANVYVTGSSWGGSLSKEDYATVKYDRNGLLKWVKRYSYGSGPDIAYAITLDDSANVYVTGSSWGGSLSEEDYATVKYDRDGLLKWEKRYSYGSGPDIARAITLDDSANVYITGSSWGGLLSEEDYATVKYDPNGVLKWIKRYSYGSGPDIARAITLDDSANVYITGSSWGGSLSEEDYATIKYDPNGVQQWVRRYSYGSGPDIAHAIVLDDSANVYITGSSWGGSISEEDFATLKYNRNGIQQWVKRYGNSGPTIANAIAISSTRNVYVAGSSWEGSISKEDLLTIKYCVQPFVSLSSTAASICSGQSVQLSASGGVNYTWSPTTGLNSSTIPNPIAIPLNNITYSVSVSNSEGCSNTASTAITVNPVSHITLNPSICSGEVYTFPDGNTSSANATNVSHFISSKGCDSTITTHLTVNNSSSGSLQISACNQYISPSGQLWNTSGTYFDTISNHVGCDSLITIHLTILHPTTSTIYPPSACGVYTAPNGQQFVNSGTYTVTIPNAVNCDSVITIHLTVYPKYMFNQVKSICEGDTYIFPDGTGSTVSVTHTSHFFTVQNCDSNITTTLTVQPMPNTSVASSNGVFSATQTGATYQWIDCFNGSLIPNATEKNFIPLANGSYAVVITKNNCTDTSDCLSIHNLSLSENNNDDGKISIYPNPTNNLTTIYMHQMVDVVYVKLYDLTGKLLHSESKSDIQFITLDMHSYPSAVYSVEITAGHLKKMIKLIKE